MKVEEFFEKARKICEEYPCETCDECPITEYCTDGIFSNNEYKAKEMIQKVENSYKELKF